MSPTEVAGIEIKHYVGEGGLRTLVPRVVGQTEQARMVKIGGSRAPSSEVGWDYYEASLPPDRLALVRALFDQMAKAIEDRNLSWAPGLLSGYINFAPARQLPLRRHRHPSRCPYRLLDQTPTLPGTATTPWPRCPRDLLPRAGKQMGRPQQSVALVRPGRGRRPRPRPCHRAHQPLPAKHRAHADTSSDLWVNAPYARSRTADSSALTVRLALKKGVPVTDQRGYRGGMHPPFIGVELGDLRSSGQYCLGTGSTYRDWP